jgi:hypothetical protein
MKFVKHHLSMQQQSSYHSIFEPRAAASVAACVQNLAPRFAADGAVT